MRCFLSICPGIVQEMKVVDSTCFLILRCMMFRFRFMVRCAPRVAFRGLTSYPIHALGGSHDASGRSGARKPRKYPVWVRKGRTSLAISILTSMNEEDLSSIGVRDTVASEVERLAKLSYNAGADGLVCSAQEASSMREIWVGSVDNYAGHSTKGCREGRPTTHGNSRISDCGRCIKTRYRPTHH